MRCITNTRFNVERCILLLFLMSLPGKIIRQRNFTLHMLLYSKIVQTLQTVKILLLVTVIFATKTILLQICFADIF